MSLVITSNVVLASTAAGIDPDLPLIAYDNIVTTSNITTTSEDADFPASRLANPETHLKWKGSSVATQYITITPSGADNLEYIGVVGHNWGSDGSSVSVEHFTGSPGAWVQIESPVIPGDDGPILWRIIPSPEQVRIKIVPVSQAPMAAVVRAGALLVMERKIYSRHMPINYGRKLLVSNNRSESGNFLGRVILGEDRETVASFQLITPAWFRTNIPPFLDAASEDPFFFVWRPNTYPDEVGFVWLTDDPAPTPQDPSSNNLIAFDLKMSGVV